MLRPLNLTRSYSEVYWGIWYPTPYSHSVTFIPKLQILQYTLIQNKLSEYQILQYTSVHYHSAYQILQYTSVHYHSAYQILQSTSVNILGLIGCCITNSDQNSVCFVLLCCVHILVIVDRDKGLCGYTGVWWGGVLSFNFLFVCLHQDRETKTNYWLPF